MVSYISRSWPKPVGAVALFTTAALVTAACGGSSGGTSTGTGSTSGGGATGGKSSGATNKTLTLGLTQGSYTTFNPWGESAGINGSLWDNGALYDSLTKLDSAGKVLPSIATSWTVSGKTVKLTLRTGVKFDDGTALDGAAVKANFDYASAHPNGAECNNYIEGVQTTVNSATSVTLTLKTPVPGILQDFAQCAGWMVEPKALLNDSGLKNTPAGSGPYTLDQSGTVSGQKYTFVRRPSYWDAKDYPFAKIVITSYASTTAADNAAKSGQVDFLQQLDATDKGSGLKILSTDPDEFRGFYITDVTGAVAKPLGDVQVRQAMNYAIDRDAIKKAIYGNYAEVVGSTPFGSKQPGYTPALATYYSYDVAKAKSLLSAAGYANGFTVKALVAPNFQKFGEAMAGYLRAVGVNLDLSVHSSDFITQMFTGQWPLVLGNYTLNPAQLQTLQGIIGTNGFWNPRKNSNPAFNTLLTQIAATNSASAQQPLLAKLATTIAADAWYINPVIVSTTMGYNAKKLSVQVTSGVPVPFIYQITPA